MQLSSKEEEMADYEGYNICTSKMHDLVYHAKTENKKENMSPFSHCMFPFSHCLNCLASFRSFVGFFFRCSWDGKLDEIWQPCLILALQKTHFFFQTKVCLDLFKTSC